MADKYWKGGNGSNWNATAPTNWADSDGGAAGATAPAAGDRVHFTALSGSGSVTLNTSISLLSFIATAFTGTFSHSSSIVITITGNDAGTLSGAAPTVSIGTGAAYSAAAASGSWSFTSTSGTTTVTFNSSGSSRNVGSLTLNGVGGTWTLGSNATAVPTATVTLTNGTLSLGGFTLQCGVFDSSNANTRVINGPGAFVITATGGPAFSHATATGLTVNTAPDITLSATATSTRTVALGGKTYGVFTVSNSASNSQLISLSTAGTVTSATFTNCRRVGVTSAMTFTITGALVYDGASSEYGTLDGGTGTGALNIGATSTVNYLVIQQLTKSGAGSLTANNSYSGGGNTGTITINNPAGGGGAGMVGC